MVICFGLLERKSNKKKRNMSQDIDLFGNPVTTKGNLKEKYGANPFTILEAKDTLWLARKKKVDKLGYKVRNRA